MIEKNRHLRVLAAKAQDGSSRDIGVVNVVCYQSAQIIGILARSAASAFVEQKLDAVDVFENRRSAAYAASSLRLVVRDLLHPARFVKLGESRNLLEINLWRCESQSFFEGLLQYGNVPVFAEDQRHNEPVIPRTNLSIGSVIAEKRPVAPAHDVRAASTEIPRISRGTARPDGAGCAT